MALSPEELEQIRQIVRDELKQSAIVSGGVKSCLTLAIYVFISIVLIHVLIVGGFTAYYLLRSP
jgi:hypothetical protein